MHVQVLDILMTITKSSSTLIQIFANYDCDFSSVNLFERILQALAKVSNGKGTDDDTSSIRLLALQAVVSISNSLAVVACENKDVIVNKDIELNLDGEEKIELSPPGRISSNLSPYTSNIVIESFDAKRKFAEHLSTGYAKFAIRPKSGIEYLITHGLIQDDPQSIAKFFLDHKNNLDKTGLGDYMGDAKDFNIKVMHTYVDLLDFSGMEVDNAMRHYLAGFRLPGEAQKIDRMLEKFAERYLINNQGRFENADAVFTLAFSVILLNTDLHNPSIAPEKKMTKNGFVRNNQGINGGQDFDIKFQHDIFDRIASNQISLREDDLAREKIKGRKETVGFFGRSAKETEELYVKERKELLAASEALLLNEDGSSSTGSEKNGLIGNEKEPLKSNKEYISSMFQVSWGSMLSVFSMMFRSAENKQIYELCVKGYINCIGIASCEGLSTERDAFVTSMCNFCIINDPKMPDFGYKNLSCIKGIVEVSLQYGNYLGSSWNEILQILSQLGRLEILSTSGGKDEINVFLEDREKVKINRRRSFSSLEQDDKESSKDREREYLLAVDIMKKVDMGVVDRIYVKSSGFDTEGITSFIACLVSVSRCEIATKHKHTPRIFSLQKVVEVAEYNMECRTRLIWSKLWGMVGELFIEAGTHSNMHVSMYAVDSLKQLAVKFLNKDERVNFNFQRLFLSPFNKILQYPSLDDTLRELVIRVIDNLVQSKCHNLRSGWFCVFQAFTIDNSLKNNNLIPLIYEVLVRIVSISLKSKNNDIQKVLICVLSFCRYSPSTELTISSLDMLGNIIASLCEGIVFITSPLHDAHLTKPYFTDDKADMSVWWPFLTGVAGLIVDDREEVYFIVSL